MAPKKKLLLKEKAARYRLTHPGDLPREKIERLGPAGLSDGELLALILRTGYKGTSVFALSDSLIKRFPVSKLIGLSYNELSALKGIGSSKAAILCACFELAKRAITTGVQAVILKPEDAVVLSGDIINRQKEVLLGFYLNGRNHVVHRETISIGNLNTSIIHPREVFQPAIRHNAASFLLVHNHPSGESAPSQEDIAVTRRISEASVLLGIPLTDHIIVAKNNFTSMKEKQLL
jgi:DNA repair protein RadC